MQEVATDVYRLGTRWANFYLVAESGELLLVDAGYPGYWKQVLAACRALGRPPGAIMAVIVTHHHVDHAGSAEAVRRTGARVLVHAADAPMVEGRHRSHVPPGFYRHSWRPSMIRYLAHTVRAGGARYRAVAATEPLAPEGAQTLGLPGRPRLLHTPGHTAGHCSVLLEDRGVLCAGDAMANFDYASGKTGVRLHRFNDDRDAAAMALDRLAAVDADTVLFGHGDPWTDGAGSAVERARDSA